ncbi:MAG TPA: adenylate/guanylate cyclase domain-containing protein [Nitrosopumilaceae archaeon]|nr:adenylate/guanylate cyclase domain-containing protein [Nitrosopumilaceae archaeon]
MNNLSNSQIEEHLNSTNSHLYRLLRDTLYDEVTFAGNYKSCCVGIVDAVNSTNTTSKLVNGKLCRYYSIFLNAMSVIVKEFGGIVIKNIGDSLLYYFPKTSDGISKSAFTDTLECSMAMIESHDIINQKMHEESLPTVDYRVSIDYGNVMIAKSSNSLNEDIFGSTVNLCAKMNSKAMPNSIVVGGDLHQIIKNLERYNFNLVTGYSSGLKLDYPIYSIVRSKTKKWF